MALNKNFSIICGWFVNNNFIHFGEDKSKSIFFGSRQEIKNSKPLNIQYNFASIYSSIHPSIHPKIASLMKPCQKNLWPFCIAK